MAGGRRRLYDRRRYEDTAEAAKRAEQRNLYRVLFSAGFFFLGLWYIGYSGRRDKAALERGDLVEAWYNQTTRRWEPPRPPMYKDPLLRNLIHLKPPHMVHKPGSPGGAQQRRESTRTLDGLTPEQAWRARQQGTR